jgi:hypothetical protein
MFCRYPKVILAGGTIQLPIYLCLVFPNTRQKPNTKEDQVPL